MSEDADPKSSTLWIRRGERLGDALLAVPTFLAALLSLFRRTALGGARRAAAR